jgi:hypothetical protein
MEPEKELTWSQKIDKYSDGIDTATAEKKDLDEYVDTMIYMNEQDEFMDDSLWGVAKDQFDTFTIANWRKMSTPARTRLRNHLLRGGVYVKSWSKNTTLTDTLYEAINEETQHEWTNQEILESIRPVFL